jgi:hypothetical protein
MNSNSELSIRAILTMIQTSTEEFSIGFVKVDGSERVIKKRVRLGVPPSEAKISRLQAEGLTNSPTESGKDWNHQLNKSHNLLLFDLEKNRPFEVKIPLIMEFNNILVRWYNEKQK